MLSLFPEYNVVIRIMWFKESIVYFSAMVFDRIKNLRNESYKYEKF